MNRRRKGYEVTDWSKSDVQIAKRLGVTKQAVAAARRQRGIPSAVGHGGARKGAGCKPKKKVRGD